MLDVARDDMTRWFTSHRRDETMLWDEYGEVSTSALHSDRLPESVVVPRRSSASTVDILMFATRSIDAIDVNFSGEDANCSLRRVTRLLLFFVRPIFFFEGGVKMDASEPRVR